jgi:hypothetical protein
MSPESSGWRRKTMLSQAHHRAESNALSNRIRLSFLPSHGFFFSDGQRELCRLPESEDDVGPNVGSRSGPVLLAHPNEHVHLLKRHLINHFLLIRRENSRIGQYASITQPLELVPRFDPFAFRGQSRLSFCGHNRPSEKTNN